MRPILPAAGFYGRLTLMEQNTELQEDSFNTITGIGDDVLMIHWSIWEVAIAERMAVLPKHYYPAERKLRLDIPMRSVKYMRQTLRRISLKSW
jgi:hypothetical protein